VIRTPRGPFGYPTPGLLSHARPGADSTQTYSMPWRTEQSFFHRLTLCVSTQLYGGREGNEGKAAPRRRGNPTRRSEGAGERGSGGGMRRSEVS
jgi:hypothetical protein